MAVVVVSNRVARAKPDEPLAGGLAAALLPMVRDSGAIWVGSSGQSSDGTREFVCAHRTARHRGARHRRHAGETLPRLLRGLRQFGAVAGAAFAARSHSCHRRRLRLVSRDQRIHGPRAGSLQHARSGILDSGLSLPEPGRGDAPARHRAAARLLPAHAVGGSPHHGRGAASRRIGRGHAGLRPDRLPDRRGPAEFRGLSAGRAWAQRS